MSVPGQCPSNLLFSAKLVRPGKVSFEYQYTDVESIFHFTVSWMGTTLICMFCKVGQLARQNVE